MPLKRSHLVQALVRRNPFLWKLMRSVLDQNQKQFWKPALVFRNQIRIKGPGPIRGTDIVIFELPVRADF